MCWTSCSTPTLRTTTRTSITARSWAASSRMAGPTGSSPGCASSSSGWRWTSCTSWGICSTAAPGPTSSWTCCSTTTMWTSSGATTTWCGWGRPPAAPSAAPPSSRRPWPTTTTGCWRTATASICGTCSAWPTTTTGRTICPSGCPTPTRPAAPTPRGCCTAAPSCTRPFPSSCSSWSAPSSTATPISRWRGGTTCAGSTLPKGRWTSRAGNTPCGTPASPRWTRRTPPPSTPTNSWCWTSWWPPSARAPSCSSTSGSSTPRAASTTSKTATCSTTGRCP